jgi:hypothetical protein
MSLGFRELTERRPADAADAGARAATVREALGLEYRVARLATDYSRHGIELLGVERVVRFVASSEVPEVHLSRAQIAEEIVKALGPAAGLTGEERAAFARMRATRSKAVAMTPQPRRLS